jgi:hypothetical protein
MGKKDLNMWNIDGRNKNAFTLFSPEFCETPAEQCQPPARLGQRIRQVLLYMMGNMHLRRGKKGRKTYFRPPLDQGHNE